MISVCWFCFDFLNFGVISLWWKSGISLGWPTFYRNSWFWDMYISYIYVYDELMTISLLWKEIPWSHDDVIKWKHFPRYWPFVRGIHRSPVNSPHKRQWRRALMFTLICARINGWVNNCEAGDLRHYHTHYDVIVMLWADHTSYPCSVFII